MGPNRFSPIVQNLAADAEFFDKAQVFLTILGSDVLQKPFALADELQKPPTRHVVFFINFQVFGELFDTLGEDTNLHFRTTGVFFVLLQIADDLGLFLS